MGIHNLQINLSDSRWLHSSEQKNNTSVLYNVFSCCLFCTLALHVIDTYAVHHIMNVLKKVSNEKLRNELEKKIKISARNPKEVL